jgi:hypothetical protein
MNMTYVASRFEASRRRKSLSFSHHAELAALDRESQDRWLDRAVAERLSVRCLREELRRERRELEKGAEGGTGSVPSSGAGTMVCPKCGVRMNVEQGAA